MANLMDRIVGFLQPSHYPPATLIMDVETSTVVSVAREGVGLALIVCENPQMAERYVRESGWDASLYRPTPPYDLRGVRAMLANLGPEVETVVQVRTDGIAEFDRHAYLGALDDMIARGMR